MEKSANIVMGSSTLAKIWTTSGNLLISQSLSLQRSAQKTPMSSGVYISSHSQFETIGRGGAGGQPCWSSRSMDYTSWRTYPPASPCHDSKRGEAGGKYIVSLFPNPGPPTPPLRQIRAKLRIAVHRRHAFVKRGNGITPKPPGVFFRRCRGCF